MSPIPNINPERSTVEIKNTKYKYLPNLTAELHVKTNNSPNLTRDGQKREFLAELDERTLRRTVCRTPERMPLC